MANNRKKILRYLKHEKIGKNRKNHKKSEKYLKKYLEVNFFIYIC